VRKDITAVRRRKIRAARLSILSNTGLTVAKLGVGISSGSVSVLSEAAHSANDLAAAIIAYLAVRVADQPADDEHPYGHGKAESFSALFEASLILLAAAYIAYEAITRLFNDPRHIETGSGIAVMALSVVVNIAVSRHLFQVAGETDSLALRADAEHLRTDVLTSAGVIVGLGLVYLTGWGGFDSIAAAAVAGMICAAAIRLIRDAIQGLMDVRLPEPDLQKVVGVLDASPEVLAYHKLRSRKSGSYRHIDAHILVSDQLSFVEAHALTERLEDSIRQALPRTEVILHTEPYAVEVKHQHDEHGGPKPPASTVSGVH